MVLSGKVTLKTSSQCRLDSQMLAIIKALFISSVTYPT